MSDDVTVVNEAGAMVYQLPGAPEGEEIPYTEVFGNSVAVLRAARSTVLSRIDILVRQRLAINEEIKELRAADDKLERMIKVADAESKVKGDVGQS